jgi:Bacterial Ig-like domain (group 3)
MHGQRRLVTTAAAVFSAFLVGGATAFIGAVPAMADTSLGDWAPAPGAYTIDTATLTISGTGGTLFTGSNDGGVATFTFGSVTIPAGATVTVVGTRPLEIVANTSFTSSGTIAGDGGSATDFTPTVGGAPGGPGGGNGASGATLAAGSGPGGGGAPSTQSNGGGGGGFGGAGAAGGVHGSGTAGAGGVAYGDLLTALAGGSGGGSGTGTGGEGVSGGGGGGAIEIASPTGSITLAASSVLSVKGGGGAVGGNGASGGGSGGAIMLEAHGVVTSGVISAKGGDGGGGGCCGGGGAGGGGRIAIVYHSLTNASVNTVAGGTSYVRTTGGCCPTSTGTEPDPTGFAGVITLVSPPTTTTATPSAASAPVGQSDTLTATVSTTTIPQQPTGSVTFSDSSGPLCTATLTAGSSQSTGSCSYTVAKLGADAITATFTPTGPDAASSASTSVTGVPAPTPPVVPVPTTGAAPTSGGLGIPFLVLGAGMALGAVAVRRRRAPLP